MTMEMIADEGQPALYPYEKSYGEGGLIHLKLLSDRGYQYFEKGARVIKQIIKNHFRCSSKDDDNWGD